MAYVLSKWPGVRCLVFMDDDAALSPDALSGVIESFEDKDVFGVNIPHESSPSGKRGGRRVTPWLRNLAAAPDVPGDSIQWVTGNGAYRASVFTDMSMKFPEAFQRFGGYALGEDLGLSFPLYKKLGLKLINSVRGTAHHYMLGGERLDARRWYAAKWYNFHLLFDTVYGDVHGLERLRLVVPFKLFMVSLAAKGTLRALLHGRFADAAAIWRGVFAARAALREKRGNELFGIDTD